MRLRTDGIGGYSIQCNLYVFLILNRVHKGRLTLGGKQVKRKIIILETTL